MAAGLPTAVQDVLSDHVIAFLRRSERIHLGPVALEDVRAALRLPIGTPAAASPTTR